MEKTEPAGANENEIRQFVIDNFLFGEGGDRLSSDDSFLETGIIDSTGVLELVTFLEQNYQLSVEDEELTPENLDSVRRVTIFVNRKLRGSSLAG